MNEDVYSNYLWYMVYFYIHFRMDLLYPKKEKKKNNTAFVSEVFY